MNPDQNQDQNPDQATPPAEQPIDQSNTTETTESFDTSLQPSDAAPAQESQPAEPTPTEAPVVEPVASDPTPAAAPSNEPSAMPPFGASAEPLLPAETDPGKTLGLVGFILSFFVSIVGLVLSAIGFSKSKKAGHKNGLALAGIIIGAVGTVVSGIYIVLFFMAMAAVSNLSPTEINVTGSSDDFFDSGTSLSE